MICGMRKRRFLSSNFHSLTQMIWVSLTCCKQNLSISSTLGKHIIRRQITACHIGYCPDTYVLLHNCCYIQFLPTGAVRISATGLTHKYSSFMGEHMLISNFIRIYIHSTCLTIIPALYSSGFILFQTSGWCSQGSL